MIDRQGNLAEGSHLLQDESGDWFKLTQPGATETGVDTVKPTLTRFELTFLDISQEFPVGIGQDGSLLDWSSGTPRRWEELGGEAPFARLSILAGRFGDKTLLDKIALIGQDGRLWLSQYDENRQHRAKFAMLGTDFVEAGFYFTADYERRLLGLKRDGSLWTWPGLDIRFNDAASVAPVRLGGDFRSLQARHGHALLTRADGEIWGLGQNRNDQLGVKQTRYLTEPAILARASTVAPRCRCRFPASWTGIT